MSNTIIGPSHVFVDIALSSKDAMLRFLSERAVELGISEESDGIYRAFLDRESLGTTGFGDGLAIPHAKSGVITRPAVCIVRPSQGIDWEAEDGVPVRLAVALFVPDAEAGATHLRLLSKVAVMMMDEELRGFVEASGDLRAISDAIIERL